MDMNLVKTFVTVYQHRSYTAAAETLGLTRPAVSMAIKRLEAQANKTLFVRSGRGIAPTSAADQLAVAFERSLELAETALSQQTELYAYCAEAVLHRIGDLDGVTFRLPPPEQEQLFSQLHHQQIDLVIDVLTQRDPSIILEPIYQDSVVVIARKDHPRIQPETLTVERYYQEGHVAYMARRDGRRLYELVNKAGLRSRKEKIEVNSSSAMAMMVSECDYLGVIGRTFAEHWAKRLGLQVLEMPFACHAISVHMAYHRRMQNDPHHKRIRDTIKAKLRDGRRESSI